MLTRLAGALCAALAACLTASLPGSGPAVAQQYPSKPIRLVVGYSPGGGNDLIARIVAARLQARLNQPVVVDNKPGAQSIVAAELVAKAAPDGYTLLVAPSGPMTINPAVYSRLPYDPQKDFVPVSLLAEFPLLLVVGADQPVKSVKELVEYGRANPKLANYASAATAFQLASELFNQRTDSRFQYIPYKGSGEMAQAVMSGQVLGSSSSERFDVPPGEAPAEKVSASRPLEGLKTPTEFGCTAALAVDPPPWVSRTPAITPITAAPNVATMSVRRPGWRQRAAICSAAASASSSSRPSNGVSPAVFSGGKVSPRPGATSW